jgi:quercetin dioxygenase-like cupin family protein
MGLKEHAMLSARSFIWPLPVLLVGAGLLVAGADRGITRESVAALLDTGQTVIDQPIVYPTQGAAKIVSAIVTMLPGEATGWHRHDVPMFGYMLEGEVSVDYGSKGTRVYRQGEAIVEAIDWPHNGRNTGTVPARILAVFIGADGVPNTEMLATPPPPQ